MGVEGGAVVWVDEEAVEVLAGERPLERCGDLLVAAPEGEQALLEDLQVVEVVGWQDLALGD